MKIAKLKIFIKYKYFLLSEHSRKKIYGNYATVVYKLEILGHFAPWGSFGLGSIGTFWAEKQDQKNY